MLADYVEIIELVEPASAPRVLAGDMLASSPPVLWEEQRERIGGVGDRRQPE